MKKAFPLVAILCLLICKSVFAYAEKTSDNIGIDEKLGQSIPLDLTFRDEKGTDVKLRNLVDKPTVLTLVYYHCSHICPQMLLGLAEVLSKLELVPGRDYKVVTLSFDDMDTPATAGDLKRNYVKAINKPFPEDSWRFLTGDRENIKKISDAAGIKYKKVMHGFIHPEVLIFLSRDGKITRYLHVSKFEYGVGYPVTFLAADFSGALADASKGIVSAGIKRTPLLCFPHEPSLQEKFFRILGILGMVTILLLVSLFIYLKVAGNKSSGGMK